MVPCSARRRVRSEDGTFVVTATRDHAGRSSKRCFRRNALSSRRQSATLPQDVVYLRDVDRCRSRSRCSSFSTMAIAAVGNALTPPSAAVGTTSRCYAIGFRPRQAATCIAALARGTIAVIGLVVGVPLRIATGGSAGGGVRRTPLLYVAPIATVAVLVSIRRRSCSRNALCDTARPPRIPTARS